ncbi:MAG TPA: hypothetical protein VGX96_15650 [Candidatus Elarobacter sp.]|jgi:hypothetical protein|nr:hypothetical protein [Candidatus Elarobacter sp.]
MNSNPPIKNVTPPPGGGGPRSVTTPTARSRQNQIIILALFVIVLVLLVRACSGRENHYEHIAHEFNQAIQNNDYNAVAKLENVETAANMSRAAFGHAVDDLAPLGKIQRVRENTPSTDPPRVHEFDVTFQNGTVHERFAFDPTDKIVRFKFDLPQKK